MLHGHCGCHCLVFYILMSLHRPGNDAPVLASITETAMTTDSVDMCPEEKGASIGASIVTCNPYSKLLCL